MKRKECVKERVHLKKGYLHFIIAAIVVCLYNGCTGTIIPVRRECILLEQSLKLYGSILTLMY